MGPSPRPGITPSRDCPFVAQLNAGIAKYNTCATFTKSGACAFCVTTTRRVRPFEGARLASQSLSGASAILRRVPGTYKAMMSASALLLACSLAFFAFVIPPVLDGQMAGLLPGTSAGSAGASSDASTGDANGAAGGFSLFSGGIAPMGATSLGGVTGTGAAGGGGTNAPSDGGSPAPAPAPTPDESSSAQETPATEPAPPQKTEEELAAAAGRIQDSFYLAQNYYAELSNSVAGSPAFWTFDPNVMTITPDMWDGLGRAYSICGDAAHDANLQGHEMEFTARDYPEYATQAGIVRQTWSDIANAASLYSRFLDAWQACPDPATHSDCFMSIIRPHIVGVQSGHETYYTLDYLESARQNMTRL